MLRFEDADPPASGDGELLVRVRAASVNPVDSKHRRGIVERPLPAVLGNDMAGTVELSRAPGFAAGDDVFGWAGSGGYAELATARAGDVARKPGGVGFEDAAALAMSGLTAWQALFDHGGVDRDVTVLIAGAAGGVGHVAVQLAAHAGARVIGTGSSRNRDFVLGLGAGAFVDYTREDVADWQATEQAARDAGARAEHVVATPRPEQLARLAELVAAGDVRIELASVLPLSEAAHAHEFSESGRTRGKIVLTP